jgi:hypothetical protein
MSLWAKAMRLPSLVLPLVLLLLLLLLLIMMLPMLTACAVHQKGTAVVSGSAVPGEDQAWAIQCVV